VVASLVIPCKVYAFEILGRVVVDHPMPNVMLVVTSVPLPENQLVKDSLAGIVVKVVELDQVDTFAGS
jgi:hypothetical protein